MWRRAWQWLSPILIAPNGNEGLPVRRPSPDDDDGPGLLSMLDYDGEDDTALQMRVYEAYLRQDIAIAGALRCAAYFRAADYSETEVVQQMYAFCESEFRESWDYLREARLWTGRSTELMNFVWRLTNAEPQFPALTQ